MSTNNNRSGTGGPAGDLELIHSYETTAFTEPDRPVDDVTWSDPGPTVGAAIRVGAADGNNPRFDDRSGLGTTEGITTPHQAAVRGAVQGPLDRLAARGDRILAASDDEIGTVNPTYPKLRPMWLAIVGVVVAIGVVGVIEYYIGAQQWERLIGGKPHIATRIALGTVVLLGALSWIAGLVWFRRRQGILREHGSKLFALGAGLVLAFAAAMAYSFAGGVEAPTSGGASGGTNANLTSGAEAETIEWVRWVIYILMTLLFTWTVVTAHLIHATAEDRRRVRTCVPIRLAAARASITDAVALLRLRAGALRGLRDAWVEGVARATSITTGYYAGVRSTLPVPLVSSWSHSSVSAPEFEEPEWLRRLDDAADRLDERAEKLARGAREVGGASSSGSELGAGSDPSHPSVS